MKIIADNKIPFLKGVLDPYSEVRYLPGNLITNKEIRDADAIIIRTVTKCNNKLLENTAVKFIASPSIGYDHIDTQYCNANNIKWANAPGCNSSSVQQYIASALVYLARHHRFDLSGKTLGIIGVGNVGTKVVSLAKTLGMNILLNDPPRERVEGKKNFVTLEQILAGSDIITLHVPLSMEGTDKTCHMVDKQFLQKMKHGSFLINSSRGAVVDELQLLKTLQSKKKVGVILDVWEHEPDINLELLNLVDIGTPHIAGYSQEGKANGTAISVRTISNFFNLGLDNWYPESIPQPDNPEIQVNCTGIPEEDIIRKIIRLTYPIEKDDKKLRQSPEKFGYLREEYPVRREFPAFEVNLKNGNPGLVEKLEALGFRVRNGS
jgi:erythronate-4-phosphate dehydrogenase